MGCHNHFLRSTFCQTASIAALPSLVILASTAIGHAASSPPVWQGEVFVTAVTSTCVSDDVDSVGDFYRMVYRPKISSTDNAEEITLIGTRNAQSFQTTASNGSLRGSVKLNAVSIFSHADTAIYATTSDLSISPSTVKTSTPLVEVNGTIKNFFNNAGCTVTIKSALLPRPQ